MGLGCPLLRDDRWLLRRRRPPTMATAGEKTEGGGGLPILEKRDSISSLWRVCKAWISIMCLGIHKEQCRGVMLGLPAPGSDHQHLSPPPNHAAAPRFRKVADPWCKRPYVLTPDSLFFKTLDFFLQRLVVRLRAVVVVAAVIAVDAVRVKGRRQRPVQQSGDVRRVRVCRWSWGHCKGEHTAVVSLSSSIMSLLYCEVATQFF